MSAAANQPVVAEQVDDDHRLAGDGPDAPDDPARRERRLIAAGLWAWFAVLTLVRFPYLWSGSAPYAEEGVVYLKTGLERSVLDALTEPHVGYLAVFSNLAGVLEAAVPWAWVPHVSVVTGLVGPAIVVALLIRADADWYRTAACIAAVVFTSTMLREWHSPIHFQFWVVCALVLLAAVPPTRRWHRPADLVLAGVAGLSGAVALVAAPVLAAAAVTSRQHRRHHLHTLGVLVVVGVVTLLVGEGRERAMPVGRLAFYVLLKTVWQPLTGDEGEAFGRDLHGVDGPVGAIVFLLLLAGYVAVLWFATSGGWRVVALGGVWSAAAMWWFALPPVEAYLSPYQGGRYALVGVVPVLCALVMSARTTRAQAIVGVIVAVAVLQGAFLASGNRTQGRVALDRFRDDVATLTDDDGVTLGLTSPTCRLSPDPQRQRRGFAVEPVAGSPNAWTVRAADVDRQVATEVFVVTTSVDGWGYVDADGYHPLDGFYLGGTPGNQPGWCAGGTPPPAVGTGVGGDVTVELPPATVDALPQGTTVYVGRGRSFADALAKSTFEPVEVTPSR